MEGVDGTSAPAHDQLVEASLPALWQSQARRRRLL
jgi:hypothetical protein